MSSLFICTLESQPGTMPSSSKMSRESFLFNLGVSLQPSIITSFLPAREKSKWNVVNSSWLAESEDKARVEGISVYYIHGYGRMSQRLCLSRIPSSSFIQLASVLFRQASQTRSAWESLRSLSAELIFIWHTHMDILKINFNTHISTPETHKSFF